MNAPARTLYVGLDACDVDIAQRFAAGGSMPTLARLVCSDRWWENASVNHLLGYHHVRAMRPVVPSRWRGGVGFLDRAWNSIPEDPSPRPHVVHFPGAPLDDRLRELRRHAAAAYA